MLQNTVRVITGANRGIGLEFVRQTLNRTDANVIACCRDPDHAQDLHELKDHMYGDRVTISKVDVSKQESIIHFCKHISEQYDRVDHLINVAGILHDNTQMPERNIREIRRDWLTHTLQVNTIGPLMMTQGLFPLLKTNGTQRTPSVVANISARVGSIGDNKLGGWYSYRISKAALNMVTKNLSIEFKRSGIHVVSLHPGTTDTELSKPFQKNVKPDKLFRTEFSVSKMYEIIEAITSETSGTFIAWDGKEIEW